MINNIELIKPLLNFDNEGDFYMLYVFKRKKDQPEDEIGAQKYYEQLEILKKMEKQETKN